MRWISLALVVFLAACQGARLHANTIDGNWASDDGVFVATFNNGAFSSRLTGTGETVVADGRYERTSGGFELRWVSIVANEGRAASCRFVGASRVQCSPSAGAPFTMTRVA